MNIRDYATGLQHIGLPTNDIVRTIDFYQSLGFSLALRTVNEAAKEQVAFLQLGNLLIETYQNNQAVGTAGAIDHLAIDVKNIDLLFKSMQQGGFQLLDAQVQYLPFWEKGVRFYTILGPNGEKVEFSEKL